MGFFTCRLLLGLFVAVAVLGAGSLDGHPGGSGGDAVASHSDDDAPVVTKGAPVPVDETKSPAADAGTTPALLVEGSEALDVVRAEAQQAKVDGM